MPTYTMQALAYHEGVPGHHLQFALALEAPGRPAFRRFGYIPAFSEGWGLYSEGLPREVGLYTDPYAELGQLEYDAWRCGRLVVDTGMHHKHWSRDGRSPTWKRTRPFLGWRSSPRSIATSPGRARRWRTRSAS